MSAVVVVATFEAKEGEEERVESTLSEAVAATHAEDGCLKYALHRDRNEPRRFVMIEMWSSQEALDAHLGQPSLIPILELAEGSLANPIQMWVCESLPTGDPGKGSL